MKPNTFEPRSEESKAQLREEAQRAKQSERFRRRVVSPPSAGAVGLRAENYKQLILGPDVKPFKDWTPITYKSAEPLRHFYSDARLITRWTLTSFDGVVIASFHAYECLCPPPAPKQARPELCAHHQPLTGSRIVADMERVIGRQITLEPLQPEDVRRILLAAPPLLGLVETVTDNGKKGARWKPLEFPYSKIAAIKRA